MKRDREHVIFADGKILIHPDSQRVLKTLAEAYPDDAPDDAMTTPLNEYGRQKAEVERLLPEVCQGNCLILRLGKVYGTTPGDGSLLDEMATLLLAREVPPLALRWGKYPVRGDGPAQGTSGPPRRARRRSRPTPLACDP